MTSITEHTQRIKAQFGDVLGGRIDAGQALALTGKVSQIDANTWQVASQSEPGKFYRVSWGRGAWACECKDFTGEGYHPAPTIAAFGSVQPVCKHIIACVLCWASGETPTAPVADLVIVTRRALKFAGHTQSNDGKVLWWKLANGERITPRTTARLSDPLIQAKLARYELVKQDCATTEIWNFYKLAGGAL